MLQARIPNPHPHCCRGWAAAPPGWPPILAPLQEVYALAAYSDHPHIVSYHSAWMEDQDLYIQLELCERGSLGERLRLKEAFGEAGTPSQLTRKL